MDCRIGVDRDGDRRIVRLAGRLSDVQVPDLLQACAESAQVCVDLNDLLSVDAAGLEALRQVRARGAVLDGVPVYIQLQLDATSRAPARRKPRKQ